MQMQEQDEFKKAFMGDEPPEPGGDPVESDTAMAEAEGAAPMGEPAEDLDDVGTETDGNAPTEDAAEGADDSATSAVVLSEGTDEMPADAEGDASYEQRYKTLQGKYNAETARLKARLAELEGQGAKQAPVGLKDGGEVDDEGEEGGEKWNRLKAQEYAVYDRSSEDEDGNWQAGNNGSKVQLEDDDGNVTHDTDDNRRLWGDEPEKVQREFNDAPRLRLADGGEVDDEADDAPAGDDDALLASFEEDYGPEFVQAIDRLIDKRARAIVAEMGGEYVSGIDAKIESVIQAANEGMGRMHGNVLRALRKDAADIANSPEFQEWIDGLEGEAKANAERVINAGDLPEILELFEQYDSKGGKEQSPEDVWAEDAAAGVKGSAPIKLPTRAAASPEDEYKDAWSSL